MFETDHDERNPSEKRSSSLRPGGLATLALAAVLALAGCENPLDVDNPNNIIDEDLQNATSVPAVVNGALSTNAQAVSRIVSFAGMATDELMWIGSRDAWNQIDQGKLDDEANEFTDAAFPFVTEARFMADKAIEMSEEFRGELENPSDRARAYLYGGLIYTYIGEAYDDFVISPPKESAPAVGEENMDQIFQTAIDYLGSAIQEARETGSSTIELRALALRARAHHSLAVWEKLNPAGSVPSDPLVNSAAAVQDAEAVLDEVGTETDWSWELEYTSATVGHYLGAWLNQRGELQFGQDYVDFPADDPTRVSEIVVADPIDSIADPAFEDFFTTFDGAESFPPQTVTSARQMHLILAESALQQDDQDGFETHINHVRTMDGLTEYSAADHGDQVSAEEMLRYERKTDLFLLGKRLSDLYRFDLKENRWQEASIAYQQPGTFFPIALTEIRANTEIDR